MSLRTLASLLVLSFALLVAPAAAQEPGTIVTVAGTGEAGFSGDGGLATEARLMNPRGLAVDALGNLYIADTGDHRVRKVDPQGIITTFAGTGVAGFSGDGGLATAARLNSGGHVAVDTAGNLFIGDQMNHRVRKVDSQGIITTVAGSGPTGLGQGGFSGDGGLATEARLHRPLGVAVDAAGNLYIADFLNNRVRKVDSQGIIRTAAGTGVGGFSGDGGSAIEAQLHHLWHITVDALGNLYLADHDKQRIRKVDLEGIITTVVGSGPTTDRKEEDFIVELPEDGALATEAQLHNTHDVAVDALGNLFVGHQADHRVWKVNPQGIITTVAGTGKPGFFGDGGPATEAQLNQPNGIAVDALGNLFISDRGNRRVRMVIGVAAASLDAVSVALEATQEIPRAFALEAFPNPFNDGLSIVFDLPERTELSLRVFNPLGQPVRTLETQIHSAGRFLARWDGLDGRGRTVGSGLYYLVLEIPQQRLVRRVTFLKQWPGWPLILPAAGSGPKPHGGPAEHCDDAGNEQVEVERLNDVIIGAHLEALELVLLRA